MSPVDRPLISRRRLLVSAAAAAGCAPPKATRFAGLCFIANQDGHSLGVVDLSRFRLRREIALDAAPEQVVAHPRQPKAYVLAPRNGTVYEVEAGADSISRRARAGNEAVAMRISRTGDALWILYRDPPSLVELPFDSLRPGRRVRLAAQPDDFDLSRETGDACVVSHRARNIAIVSLKDSAVARTIDASTEPSIARFRKDGKHIIAGSQTDRSLTIYDVALAKSVVRLPISIAPRNFCFTEDGGQLYITGDGMDAVVTVYPYRTEVAETRLAGHAPGVMAVTDTNPAYLMLANPESAGVTVMDVETGKLVAVVTVGKCPCAIVITPDQQYALVLDRDSSDMAVIRMYALSGSQVGGVRVKRYHSAPLFTMVPVGQGPVSAAVVELK
jgi:DNA-binding beta-propeller fold protein YncE